MQNSYGSEEREDNLYFSWEKFSALHIYFVRKILLGLCLVLLFVVQMVSKGLGFDCEVSVSDRRAWVWKPYEFIPLWVPIVKKKWKKVN